MLVLRNEEVCPYTSICLYNKEVNEIIKFCYGSIKRENQFTCEYTMEGKIIGKNINNFNVNDINQVIDGKFIGYHENLYKFNLKKGDVITIKKGIIYHTMKDGNYYITETPHNVKVDHLIHGYQYIYNDKLMIKNTEVVWLGLDEHWNSVDINDVI